jgi:hypothetical protein
MFQVWGPGYSHAVIASGTLAFVAAQVALDAAGAWWPRGT